MSTPMQRQRARQMEARQAQQLARAPADGTQSQHIRLIALENDVRRLRSLERIADRAVMKRDELLPRWMPHAQTYLDGGRVYQNPVLVYCVIWLLDTWQFERALSWGEIAIQQGQQTPDNIKSGLPTFIASNILDWAERESEAGRSVRPWFWRLFRRVRRVWRINERLTARYYKFAALQHMRDAGTEQPGGISSIRVLRLADALMARAEALHPKVQVKTQRSRIAMRLRALQKDT